MLEDEVIQSQHYHDEWQISVLCESERHLGERRATNHPERMIVTCSLSSRGLLGFRSDPGVRLRLEGYCKDT